MNPPARRITHRDIARAARVSGAAVSLALRNDPSLPPATCRRIQRIATRLGYTPDAQLAKLMAHVRRARLSRDVARLGLLTAFPDRAPWPAHPYLRRIHAGLCARAAEAGYKIEEFWLAEPGMTAARLHQIMLARGIEGLLVLGTPRFSASFEFDFSPFACATIGYSINLGLHRACQHQYQEMFQALRRLQALGYRRPGLALTEDFDARTMRHYSAAFLRAQADQPAARRVPVLLKPELVYDDFAAWFRRHRPDVVLAQTPGAVVVLDWLRRLGRAAPERCGFAALDVNIDLPFACSGIRQNYEGVTAAAVDLVVSQLQRHEHGLPPVCRVTMVEGRWIDGETTRPV